MSDIPQNLDGLLSEIVSDYSGSGNPHIDQESPAAIGQHLHPLLARMCEEAEKRGASDIFISTGFPPSVKIDGNLIPVPLPALTPADTEKIVFSTMNTAQREEYLANHEINYSVQSKGNVRYRVNSYHEQGRCGLVMRRINTDIPSVEDLALPLKLKELVMQKRGLLILAGATGSGKSTSMAAMLDHRNRNLAGHIITIEDPIEYLHVPRRSIITQREVGIDTVSWEVAVQSAMRQAPDVVCVGEVRGIESMEYALQLAQTGHLCIFTIHATTANQTIERIMNLYPEERHKQVLIDLAMNLVGIIGQRLVVKKGGKGRTAIVDLMINTPAVQDLVFKGDLMGIKELMTRGQGDGMQTFDQHLFDLYVAGTIDYDEAIRQADSANDLRLRIQLYEEGNKPDHIFDRVSDLNLI
ncbi:PilT/PilU family type 4a pilus ATPase [Neisseria sp. WLZKY-1]|uniref:PilT/PilU family type 4a pilus ATPase n=1 Tax=Neisseria sp. WLZKY-1 TaxID=3390377 RepID=UPI00397992EE